MVHRTMTRRTLETLSFDNTYACLPRGFYARLNPTPFSASPYLVHASPAAAALIDLDPEQFIRPEFAALFGGSVLAPGMEPLAMLYSGHQFGVYVQQQANPSIGKLSITERKDRLLVNARTSRGINQSFSMGIMPRRIARTAACVRS